MTNEEAWESMGMHTLQIYAQSSWHAEAKIVGTRNALKDLRRALDQAIEHGSARAEFFVSDGEGYWVEIEQASDEQLAKMPLPYTVDRDCDAYRAAQRRVRFAGRGRAVSARMDRTQA